MTADRSHAPRGNAFRDALRHCCAVLTAGRGASQEAFPRGAWERSNRRQQKGPLSKRAFCLGAIQIRT
ncbi:DUF1534 domain-containing protein [Pseudomonas sp. PA-5-4B]|nr:DUF1534 domain-containing protein [Pseudomonas sp. PA-5-4B]